MFHAPQRPLQSTRGRYQTHHPTVSVCVLFMGRREPSARLTKGEIVSATHSVAHAVSLVARRVDCQGATASSESYVAQGSRIILRRGWVAKRPDETHGPSSQLSLRVLRVWPIPWKRDALLCLRFLHLGEKQDAKREAHGAQQRLTCRTITIRSHRKDELSSLHKM